MEKNKITGAERKIRMSLKQSDSDKNWHTWMWLREDNNWLSYSPYTILKLENLYVQSLKNINSSNIFKINILDLKKSYIFDLQQMTQTNEKSKYKREIKRIASDITNDLNNQSRTLRKRSVKNYDESKNDFEAEIVHDSKKDIKKIKKEPEISDDQIKNEILKVKSVLRTKKSNDFPEEDASENEEPINKKHKSCAKSTANKKEENTGNY